MSHPKMFTELDVGLLAEAFPLSMQTEAVVAATLIQGVLAEQQWTNRERFAVGGEEINVPGRLRFTGATLDSPAGKIVAGMVACLQTRSTDGFQRQRALQSILIDIQPWSAPFVVSLIGEYVVEIIEDIAEAATPPNVAEMTTFIARNTEYWEITKQRVASYWNAYYRHGYWNGYHVGKWSLRDYPGFKLANELESGLRLRMRQSSQISR